VRLSANGLVYCVVSRDGVPRGPFPPFSNATLLQIYPLLSTHTPLNLTCSATILRHDTTIYINPVSSQPGSYTETNYMSLSDLSPVKLDYLFI
jgi:hypothetical protein